MILVSACLLGENCRYDGGSCFNKELLELIKEYDYKAICPESDSGLPTPRPPAEIKNGNGFDVLAGIASVKDKNGKDVSGFFIKGSRNILKNIEKDRIKAAVLKSRSPSCGKKKIYSGKFDGSLKDGSGVTAAFLKQQKIPVFSEEELSKVKLFLEENKSK